MEANPMKRGEVPLGSIFKYAHGGKIAWRIGPVRSRQPTKIGNQPVLQERILGPDDAEVEILWPLLQLVP